MSKTTLSLEDLIDNTYDLLVRPQDHPMQDYLYEDISAGTTTMKLSTYVCSENDVLEIGQEMILIRQVTSDANPTLTVVRGYMGSPTAAHITTDDVLINPNFSRYRIKRAILKGMRRINTWIPNIQTSTLYPTVDSMYIEVPSTTMRVLQVYYLNPTDGRFNELGGWEYWPNVPTALIASGQAISVPSWQANVNNAIQVVRQTPWAFSTADPIESDTIDLWAGTEELPAFYAAAFLASGREISRTDIDHVEEWVSQSPRNTGLSAAYTKQLWNDFYRTVEEARKLVIVPKYRPFKKQPLG